MSFEQKLNEYLELVNDSINTYLPKPEGYEAVVKEAMGYSLSAGGKRLRPVFLLSACEAFGGKKEAALPFAAAMEMIHTYSLVHDDLPAMDDDDYRRGRLSCHAKYGEAYGILTGDALLNRAFEVMLAAIYESLDSNTVKAAQVIAGAAGIEGMIAGQTADMFWEGKTPDEGALIYINERKTGALIKAALEAGAYLGGASDESAARIAEAGMKTGIAFQIRDDILDCTGDFESLGKPINSDEKNDKTTYVTIHGIEKCEQMVKKLSDEAVSLVRSCKKQDGSNIDSEFIINLTSSLINRIK